MISDPRPPEDIFDQIYQAVHAQGFTSGYIGNLYSTERDDRLWYVWMDARHDKLVLGDTKDVQKLTFPEFEKKLQDHIQHVDRWRVVGMHGTCRDATVWRVAHGGLDEEYALYFEGELRVYSETVKPMDTLVIEAVKKLMVGRKPALDASRQEIERLLKELEKEKEKLQRLEVEPRRMAEFVDAHTGGAGITSWVVWLGLEPSPPKAGLEGFPVGTGLEEAK